MSAAILHAPADVIWTRILDRVEVTPDGCWLWTGTVNSRGYGCIGSGKRSRTITVHRVSAMVRDGGIPDGMTVDHMCHHSDDCLLGDKCPHRRCVNPDHLAVVSIGENVSRRWESGTCRKGHPLVAAKKRGRFCPTCKSAYMAEYWRLRAS